MNRIRLITSLAALAVLLSVIGALIERTSSSLITAAVTTAFATAIIVSVRLRSSRLGGSWGRKR